MQYTLLALAVAGLVNAQTNSTLIPSGISSSCSTFLNKLNADTELADCVGPLINATASFSPTASANLTGDDINYTLATICKSTAGCSDGTIRTWLSSFYSSCQAELTSSDASNAQIRELYDILYVVNPLQGAVCAIDSANQQYCVNEIIMGEKANGTSTTAAAASGSASGSASAASASASGVSNNTMISNFAVSDVWSPVSIAAENLYITISTGASTLTRRMLNLLAARQAQTNSYATIIMPNTTTYGDTNLPFLFLQASMSSGALCTPCTRQVMVSYIKWESKQPYALGLSQSPILGGQPALWNAINSTCGAAYVNAITSQVGDFSSSNNGTSGAMGMTIPSSAAVFLASALGFAFIA